MANKKCLRTALLLICSLLAATALSGCKHKNDPEALNTNVPVITADPDGSVTAGPTATPADLPEFTDVPVVTADPDGSVTAGPTATPEAQPAHTDVPVITSDPGGTVTAGPTATPTARPIYTDVPVVTSDPGGSVTAGPTATPTAVPVYTDVPVVTSDPGGSVTAGPTATPTPKPAEATPSPVASPIPTSTPGDPNTPTPVPTATPAPDPADAFTQLEPGTPVLFDLDYDGEPEEIVVTRSEGAGLGSIVTISVKVGKNGKTLEDSYRADVVTDAFINNFNSGDHRAEIVVSTQVGSRDRTVKCLKLNSGSNGLVGCSTEGVVTDVSGEAIIIHRYIDLMGTWECSAAFAFSYSDFALEQTSPEWTVIREGDRWCTLSSSVFLGLDSTGGNNEVKWLDSGTMMYPVATDLQSYIDVKLESGASGYLPISVDGSGNILYGEKSISEIFSDLTFIY